MDFEIKFCRLHLYIFQDLQDNISCSVFWNCLSLCHNQFAWRVSQGGCWTQCQSWASHCTYSVAWLHWNMHFSIDSFSNLVFSFLLISVLLTTNHFEAYLQARLWCQLSWSFISLPSFSWFQLFPCSCLKGALGFFLFFFEDLKRFLSLMDLKRILSKLSF